VERWRGGDGEGYGLIRQIWDLRVEMERWRCMRQEIVQRVRKVDVEEYVYWLHYTR
jgi:hypothetical protein